MTWIKVPPDATWVSLAHLKKMSVQYCDQGDRFEVWGWYGPDSVTILRSFDSYEKAVSWTEWLLGDIVASKMEPR